MLRSLLTFVAFALCLGGCDTGAPGQAQASAGQAAAAGEPDRSLAGEMIPTVRLTDVAKRTLDLGVPQGRPVLLNLWATWCAPCVKEMPQLDALAARYGDRVAVVVASQDVQGAKAVEPFFARHRLASLDPWLDPQNLLMDALEADALPLTILYDAQGREVWRMTGPFDWASEEAFALVEEGLGDPSLATSTRSP